MIRWRLEKQESSTTNPSQVCLFQGSRQIPIKCWTDTQRNVSYYYNHRIALFGQDMKDYDGIDQAFQTFAKRNGYRLNK